MQGTSQNSLSGSRRWLLSLVALVLVFQFNNCGTYQEPDPGSLMSLYTIDCPDADCITPTIEDLSIQPILPGGNSQLSVQGGLSEFNIGGDCNEGGFALNIVRWDLRLNGVTVRTSEMPGMAFGNATANVNTRCMNGRFMIYVSLAPIPMDNNLNRSGLLNPFTGVRSPYDLYIEICGQNSLGEPPRCNPTRARTRVMLLPI